MSDTNSTWPTPVDTGTVRNYITGLQDAQQQRHERAVKSLEKGIMVGIGVWGLDKLRKNRKAK